MVRNVFKAAALAVAGLMGAFLATILGRALGLWAAATWFAGSGWEVRDGTETWFALGSLLLYCALVVFLFFRWRSRIKQAALQESAAAAGAERSHDTFLASFEENLSERRLHYAITRKHADYSFLASLSAIFAGLLAIVGMFFLLFEKAGSGADVAVISGFAGMLSEFIGINFLLVYKKTHLDLRNDRLELAEQKKILMALEESERLGEAGREIRTRYVASILTPDAPPDSPGPGTTKIGGATAGGTVDGGPMRLPDASVA